MEPDLRLVRELGEQLAPPTGALPADLRRRVLSAPVRAPRPRSWVSSRIWQTALVGAAAAAAIAAITGPVVITHSGDGRPPPATVDVVRLASERAAAVPAAIAWPDQFIYTESVVLYRTIDGRSTPPADDGPLLVREWRSVNGTHDGLVRERPRDQPAAAWRDATVAGCRDGYQSTAVPEWRVPCMPDLGSDGSLPVDVDAMLAYLRRSGTSDDQAFDNAARVLYVSQHASAVQAAVVAAIGRIPGITVRPGVVDAAGRPGVALAYRSRDAETELVFDASTYAYLGVNRTILRRTTPNQATEPASRILIRQAVEHVAIVDSIGSVR
ncbi:CU044_5270 family protein [Dactylosporangium sp. NPDC051485]|uniref:CU044_5270 family protein n=1 Tax=Dactylosporangium sp. NPDC051485 TaxID=3154846 RepID=UPI00343CFCBC